MKIFLSGSTGMVGRNILEHIPTNWEVYAPVRSELDLLDYSSVFSFLEKYSVDIVVHVAGTVGGVHTNMRDPVRFLVENWTMGQNVIMASRKLRVPRLINLGSSCMFPKDWRAPIREGDIFTGSFEPTNEGYAIAKSALSRLCLYITEEENELAYKTLIPCNLYGCYDSFEEEKSHFIPAVIHKMHQAKSTQKNTVTIWGDGTVRRECLYAADLAECVLHAVVNFETLPSIMNVGSGIDYTIREYYEKIAEVLQYRGDFIYDISKPNGVQQKLMDVSLLKLWGWEPKTSLSKGIAETYGYYLEHCV